MKMTLKYRGGPRSMVVEVKDMRILPTIVGCKDEAHAKGMHGVYRKARQPEPENEATYLWHELPLRIKTDDEENDARTVAQRVLR